MGSLIQTLARGSQSLHEHGADLGRESATEHDHTVVALIHVQLSARVPSAVLSGLAFTVHPAPASHDALDMIRGAGTPDRQQPFLGLRRGDARQRADLGVRELATR